MVDRHAMWSAVGDDWPHRQEVVAGFIFPGSRVVDLGAGAQGLRERLPFMCLYTPVDLVARSDDTVILDVEDSDWSLGRSWDVAVLAGLLEHVADPFAVIERAKGIADHLIVTRWKHAPVRWTWFDLREELGCHVHFDFGDHWYAVTGPTHNNARYQSEGNGE